MVYENSDLDHYNSLAKGLTKRVERGFNYVKNSRVGQFLYDPEIEGKIFNEAKDKLKTIGKHIRLPSSAKDELPKVVGTSSGLATLAATSSNAANIIPKVNEVLFYVKEINGRLYDTLNNRYLDNQEAAFYNVAKVNILGIPVLNIAAIATTVLLPPAIYYVSKKTTERALKSLEES